MKTLLVMRHAKSSWAEPDMADFDRPLNHRGERDAPRMGKWLKKQGSTPDLVLTSPALRARTTAETSAAHSGCPRPVEIINDFYPGEPVDYLYALRGVPNAVERVMVVGHNPGVESLVSLVSGVATGMSTAAVARIDFSIDAWAELNDSTRGKLIVVWRPKELP